MTDISKATMTFHQRTAFVRRRLSSLGTDIKGILEQGRKMDSDPNAGPLFKAMCKDLELIYKKFNDTWNELMELHFLNGSEAEFPTAADSTNRETVKRYYYECQAKWDDLIASQSLSSQVLNQSTLNQTLCGSTRARFPKINIPKFNGELAEWPLFRDTFKSLVSDDPNLSNIEKFHFLLGSLSGEALSVVRNLPVLEENFILAWEALHKTFDNKRKLAACYLHKLLNFKPMVGKPSMESLKHFVNTVSDSITAFKRLKIDNPTDFILFELAIQCLDSKTREAFEMANTKVDYPTFESLISFVQDRCHALSMAVEPSHQAVRKQMVPSNPNKFQPKPYASSILMNHVRRPVPTINLTTNNDFTTLSCKICQLPHRILDCPTYRKADIKERMNLIKRHSCCLNCLHPGHFLKQCPSKTACQKCQRRHHTSLHYLDSTATIEPESTSKKPREEVEHQASSTACYNVTSMTKNVLLGTARAFIRTSSGSYEPIRLILDSGSQHSLITKECVDKLGLVRVPSNKILSGVGSSDVLVCGEEVTCTIKAHITHRYTVQADAIVVPSITCPLPQRPLPEGKTHSFLAYDLADPLFGQPGPIDFLLGADLYADVVTGAPIIVHPEEPRLINTIFGHIVIGRFQLPTTKSVTLMCNSIAEIDQSLKRFWQIEEVKAEVKPSSDDQLCEDHFRRTHYRTLSGRYVVVLPFRRDPPDLGPSKHQATSRLLKVEADLSRKPTLQSEYRNFMKEYFEMGHMQKATNQGEYYIPHHGVSKLEGNNRKLRVVFDASSKTSRGSLNDHLLTGPKLQTDIVDILLRFRLHLVAFTADIQKMYRQIRITPAQQKYQHIFWRSDPADRIQDFELVTLTYGLSCAPFLALRVIRQLIKDEGCCYPKAAEVLTDDVYIDDILTGAPSEEDAVKLKDQVTELLGKGKFPLGKWASNSSNLLTSIDGVTRNHVVDLGEIDNQVVKILGLQWNPQKDVFSYQIREPPTINVTKRSILSATARIYDPLGFLAPMIFLAKRLLQEIWLLKKDWDETLPEVIVNQWTAFIKGLPAVKTLEIPRCVSSEDMISCDVVGFSDASEKGYCGALYLRVTRRSGIGTFLLKSKTKLAPIKPILSIPRLELCGALLLAKLYDSCMPFFNRLPMESIRFFTDSTTVLSWLRAPPHILKIFVANRVCQILEITDSRWNHVKSEDNPADLGSRGVMPAQLEKCQLWWLGPRWMRKPESEWPSKPISYLLDKDLPDVRQTSVGLHVSEQPQNDLTAWMENFSVYSKLIRTLAYVLRFISNCGTPIKEQRKQGPISCGEFKVANTLCIRVLQSQFYPAGCERDKVLAQLFNRLNVFKDQGGLLRVGGRIRHSTIPFEKKHPILLPRRCHFNDLLVDYYHRLNLHAGPTIVRSAIEHNYWIPSCRNLIKSRKRTCVVCYRYEARPRPPYMGDLPALRFHGGRAFAITGVDFAGPFICKESRRRRSPTSKAYICLFVCLGTKAIHIEIASTLSTEAFLDCFDKFVARRGLPSKVMSDCGTNFVGASNYLQDLQRWHDNADHRTSIIEHVAPLGVDWVFNPPCSPHFGGLWEAAIKSTKRLLIKTMGTQVYTESELYLVCLKIEAILNSRPLMPLSSDPNDLEPLTPGHFLIGAPLKGPPEVDFTETPENRLTRWQHLRQRVQHFWSRWKSEYLTSLQQRTKWLERVRNLAVGDLVLLSDFKTLPTQWPLARVTEVHPGSDGVVRVVTVKTAGGLYKRPVTKLCSLAPVVETDANVKQG